MPNPRLGMESLADAVRSHDPWRTSFNYDGILEFGLRSANIPYHRTVQNEAREGIAVCKPHGSFDFCWPGVVAGAGPDGPALPPEYPLQAYAEHVDIPATSMPLVQARQPRVVSAVVLPSEASYYSKLSWVRVGHEWWQAHGPTMTHLVIVGLAYQACDRQEIDDLIGAVPTAAKVHLADPQPCADLTARLRARFARVMLWLDGPATLG